MAFLAQFRDRAALRSVRQGGATTGAAKTTRILSSLNQAAAAHSARHPVAALQRLADHYTAPLQRVEEDEDIGQMKAIQRMEEEEDLGQLKAIQRMTDEDPQQHMPVQRAEAGPAGAVTGGGLPGGLRSGIESLSGLSMQDVKVHRNSDAPAKVGAHAYAQGRDIHLAPGQDRHLPHEAWHVVQQAQGRVKPTLHEGGVAINDDAGLEKEADVMGAKAATAGASPAYDN